MDNPTPPRSRLLPGAGALLIVLCLAWAINQWHLSRLEAELQAIADEKLIEFRPAGMPGASGAGRIAAKVIVAKPYVFWGSPSGKVSVFIGRFLGDGREAIESFDFFFAREGEREWNQTESGYCSSAECSVEGKALLDALGEQF